MDQGREAFRAQSMETFKSYLLLQTEQPTDAASVVVWKIPLLPKVRCSFCGMEGDTFCVCQKSICKKCKEKETLEQTLPAEEKELEKCETDSEHQALQDEKKEQVEELMKEEAMNQPNAAVQRQEKELIKPKSHLDDAQETPLDNSHKEIAELHCSNASQDSKAQEAALSAETRAREELEAAMEREQEQFEKEEEKFISQIDSVRGQIRISNEFHDHSQDRLRQEISQLQERLKQEEARSQDLTPNIISAMQPLFRQIENLQVTLGAQSAAWERVEKNLDRLALIALAMAQEKERTANDHFMELSARVASLEAANKQEKAQLAAEVESDKPKLEELQDISNSAAAQLESGKQWLNEELIQLKMDKVCEPM